MPLTFTLRVDGATDDAMLMPILRWALVRALPDIEIQGQFADPRQLPRTRSGGLAERIRTAIEFFPCDLLFVHRDAENQDPELRVAEIQAALAEFPAISYVPVIPVRMSEAWLLIDEPALRRASGNPNGKVSIVLPPLQKLEQIPNPKDVLQSLLKTASELRGRRLKAFRAHECIPLLSDSIRDFSPLDQLPAFRRLSKHIEEFGAAYRRRQGR